tara:strand:+ start:2254 stop:2499 length:246 start_codon:yes stop_codon:yes gene_type:complete
LRDEKNSLNKTLKSFQKILNQAGPAASGSYSLIAAILMFTFLGWYIDQNTSLYPNGTLAGVGFGIVVGFYLLFKSIKKYKF